MSLRLVDGMGALAQSFDGFILDQWGVLHDGVVAYPGAVACLARLREAGKRVVVLSNSGRRSAANAALLEKLGFPSSSYDDLISAGEDAWRGLDHRADPFYAALGRRCLVIGRSDSRSLLDGLDLEIVESVGAAEFVLLLSVDRPLDAYRDLAAAMRRRALPMICANPDLLRFTPEGTQPAPGALALIYERLGGAVHYHGKPHPPIYETAFASLDIADRRRVLAIGDSLDHDVLGAKRAGIDSVLVTGGIYAETLGWPPNEATLKSLIDAAGADPTWLAPAFVW